MTRKIIIYNSFAHDASPHVTLLQRQLTDVRRELLTCATHDRKALVNERNLLQRHLRKLAHDSNGAFLGGEKIAEASQYGKGGPLFDARTTTLRDGMGTPAEIAYGKGWQEYNGVNPYDDPVLAKEWTRGRQDQQTARKIRGNSFRGGVRGKSFQEPKTKPEPINPGHVARGRDAFQEYYVQVWYGDRKLIWEGFLPATNEEDAKRKGKEAAYRKEPHYNDVRLRSGVKAFAKARASHDYKSERGFVAKFVDNKTGKTLARSEPFIAEAAAKKWLADNTKALVNKGYRNFKAAVEHSFFDPAIAADTK